MFEIPRGRVIHTLADGSQYEDCGPIPCERESYIVLDEAGEPFCLMIDNKPYRIKRSPRFRSPEMARATVIYIGRRIP